MTPFFPWIRFLWFSCRHPESSSWTSCMMWKWLHMHKLIHGWRRRRRDEWVKKKKRKKTSPPERQSSRMSLISLAGKVRLRLRSASLTAICHSTSFAPHPHPSPASPLFALLLGDRLSFNLAVVGDGQDEVDGELAWVCRQAGRECRMCREGGEGGALLEANPWGCSVQGPLLLSLCLSWQEKRQCLLHH